MLDPRFAQTEFLVEATGYEKLCCWREYAQDQKVSWEHEYIGLCVTVGKFADYPVNISVSWAVINGKRILFWEAVSRVVDINMIEKWFDKHCNPTYDGGRLARTNAMNFHSVIRFCLER